MSNFDRAVKALNDVDEAIDHLADNEAYVTALEAAGREMLESLNALEYSHHSTRKTLDSYKPSTIETYGLTQKDME